MRKFIIAALLPLLLMACGQHQAHKVTLWSHKMVDSHGLGDFYCNRHYQTKLDSTGWDYVSGLVAGAVLETWKRYPEKSAYYEAVKAFADVNRNDDGTMILHGRGGEDISTSKIE